MQALELLSLLQQLDVASGNDLSQELGQDLIAALSNLLASGGDDDDAHARANCTRLSDLRGVLDMAVDLFSTGFLPGESLILSSSADSNDGNDGGNAALRGSRLRSYAAVDVESGFGDLALPAAALPASQSTQLQSTRSLSHTNTLFLLLTVGR